MELRKFEIGGREVEFANASRGTRSGFAHDTTMFVDGRRIQEATCHYLNRTWECYTYQTVMLRAVYREIEEIKFYIKNRFMEEKGYKKLTAQRKDELEAVYKADEGLQFYEEVKAKLR